MKSPARASLKGAQPSRGAGPDRGFLLSSLILVLALSATALGWYQTREAAREAANERFQSCISELLLITHQALVTREGILRGGAALFMASDVVTAHEWRDYVKSLALGRDFTDIRLMGYAPLLSRKDLPRLSAITEAQSLSDFHIHPETKAQTLAPVLYLEPFELSLRPLRGFDLQSDPNARLALEKARATGSAVIASPHIIPSDSGQQKAPLLMVYPVFRGRLPTSAEARRHGLVGFVLLHLDLASMIEHTLGDRLLEFAIQIYDGAHPSQLLYDSLSDSGDPAAHAPRLSSITAMRAAGHDWLIRFATLPQFERTLPIAAENVILAAGIALSLLLFLISLVLATTRKRANKIAHEMNRAFMEERTRLEEIASALGEGIYVQDSNGNITFTNPAAAQILGHSQEGLLGHPSVELIHPESVPAGIGLNQHALSRSDAQRRSPEETHFLHKNGTAIPVSVISAPIFRDGKPMGSVVAFRDVSEQKKAEAALRLSQQFEALFHYSSDALFLMDSDGRITDVNRVTLETLGISREELVGRTPDHFVRWTTVPPPGQTLAGYFATLDVAQRVRGEAEFVRKDGSSFFVEVAFSVMTVDSRRHIFASARDISERKEAERRIQQALEELEQSRRAVSDANRRLAQSNEELQRLSRRDGLTNIANRRSFDEYLDLEWSRAVRDQRPISLMIADVDYFKAFNDRYGHQAGDDCLRRVAKSLSQQLSRSIDMVARYGGEEFVVILPETPLSGATNIAERLRRAVAEMAIPHEGSAIARHVTISIGVAATVPRPGLSRDRLVSAADNALYRAKKDGRNQVCSVSMPES